MTQPRVSSNVCGYLFPLLGDHRVSSGQIETKSSISSYISVTRTEVEDLNALSFDSPVLPLIYPGIQEADCDMRDVRIAKEARIDEKSDI